MEYRKLLELNEANRGHQDPNLSSDFYPLNFSDKSGSSPLLYYTLGEYLSSDPEKCFYFSLDQIFLFKINTSLQIQLYSDNRLSEYFIVQFLTSGRASIVQENTSVAVTEQLQILDIKQSPRLFYNNAQVFGVAIPRQTLLNTCPEILYDPQLTVHTTNSFVRMFKTMVQQLVSNPPARVTSAESSRILRVIINQIKLIILNTRKHFDRQSEKICYFIKEHIKDPKLSIQFICTRLFVSRASLYRHFDYPGGINQFINEIRMSLGFEMMIKSPYLSVKKIAYELGFSSVSYFSTCFKKTYYISPCQLRAKLKEK